ncbi:MULTISPECIES: hypothetical protein [Kitasatospora]|uniref:A-factor biosynthesis hotdog domain-containing protein n=1 Tax=Kitasatospora setae (strain ATCC 33774 / DSM 43861 / JCM 3304 / KCC A-0304 / NBRC 14216 / KM-6054) TaxID=452652 RepID=E4N3U6_KITSK|nr:MULTISPECIES: hypothetical protein [Kitasatospora]BAJ31577.1 hypothetical protein KSE_58060 [Kitasatospora setae KM-6054]
MAATTVERVRSNPTLYGETGFHPRALLALAIAGWAAWCEEHLVPIAELMHTHGIGFPLSTAELRYPVPSRYTGAAAFETATTVVFRRPRDTALSCDTTVSLAGRQIAEVRLTAGVSHLDPAVLCGAGLGPMPAALLDRLPADHRGAPRRHSPVPAALDRLAAEGGPVVEHTHPFTLHRHLCEVGDQWTFVPVPDLFAAARDELLLAHADTRPLLRSTWARPLRSLDFDIHRPLGFLESATVRTTAHLRPEGPAFSHRIVSARGETHATAVETFHPVPTPQEHR